MSKSEQLQAAVKDAATMLHQDGYLRGKDVPEVKNILTAVFGYLITTLGD